MTFLHQKSKASFAASRSGSLASAVVVGDRGEAVVLDEELGPRDADELC